MSQSSNEVLMIEPLHFGSNPETLADNHFQHSCNSSKEALHAQRKAREEFHGLRLKLEEAGVTVHAFSDDQSIVTPDSVFPNNWFSTHKESVCVLYPMKAPTRRLERREEIIEFLKSRYQRFYDLSHFEKQHKFLEGTGSLVLDRANKLAYASLSERTNPDLIKEWATILGFDVIIFRSYDQTGALIYHTNVMMNIGTGYAVICLEAIKSAEERDAVRKSLEEHGIELITITLEQLHAFCGNVIEVRSKDGRLLLVMSATANSAFTDEQLKKIESYAEPLFVPLDTVERYGGGSARCMLAKIF
ncbi:MAG: amidinotransferase [Candidatus Dadabacteria bacterium]|nr:MAG: amidinotransferase [Candidatus Dadabacteria bacterium]